MSERQARQPLGAIRHGQVKAQAGALRYPAGVLILTYCRIKDIYDGVHKGLIFMAGLA